MPIDYSRYPDNWKEFSLRIRTHRAGNRCEQCHVPNHAWIWRDVLGQWHFAGRRALREAGYEKPPFEVGCTWTDGTTGKIKVIEVVLTVAHLDAQRDVCQCEEETGHKCAIDSHVLALCQRCHLIYDGKRHSFNARRTRATNAGQLWLGDIEYRYASTEVSA